MNLKCKPYLKSIPGSKIQAMYYVLNGQTEDKSRNEWVRFANISGLVRVESVF